MRGPSGCRPAASQANRPSLSLLGPPRPSESCHFPRHLPSKTPQSTEELLHFSAQRKERLAFPDEHLHLKKDRDEERQRDATCIAFCLCKEKRSFALWNSLAKQKVSKRTKSSFQQLSAAFSSFHFLRTRRKKFLNVFCVFGISSLFLFSF